ncbi:MAG TPA: class I SAM-dependent methyltransferase [Burkholderiaceae bacterium]|jgi:SAM-dependent methyltransferase|nr:class I SAM-dependent methyltransferase [Burkholderiaceae bacterium]
MSVASDRSEPCPVCGSAARRMFIAHGHGIHTCGGCSHQFAALAPAASHVEAVYGDDYFNGGGAGYPDYLGDAALRRAQGRRYGRLLGRHIGKGTLLDVGCAAGFILQGLQDEGWTGMGVEPNPSMAAYGRERLGLQVTAGAMESLPRDAAPSGGFDVVTMIQVIAHFHDLRRALESARDLTRPGGHWLIETWDNASLSARLLGRRWHEYSPPSVLHMFSRSSLIRIAADMGMRPVASGRPAKWISGAQAKSLLRYKFGNGPLGRLPSAALGVVPDRSRLPYPAEDVFWMLFERSA